MLNIRKRNANCRYLLKGWGYFILRRFTAQVFVTNAFHQFAWFREHHRVLLVKHMGHDSSKEEDLFKMLTGLILNLSFKYTVQYIILWAYAVSTRESRSAYTFFTWSHLPVTDQCIRLSNNFSWIIIENCVQIILNKKEQCLYNYPFVHNEILKRSSH